VATFPRPGDASRAARGAGAAARAPGQSCSPDLGEELAACPPRAPRSALEHTRRGNSSTNGRKNTSPFHREGERLVIRPVAFPGTWKWSLPRDAEKALCASGRSLNQPFVHYSNNVFLEEFATIVTKN